MPAPAFVAAPPPRLLRRPRAAEALPRSRAAARARARRGAVRAAASPAPAPLFGGRGRGSAPVVLVLGGASALGLEIARLFCAEGWRVVSLDYYDASVAACGVNGCALPEDPAAKVSLALPSGAPPGMQMRVAEECLRKAGVVEAAVCVNATLGYATGSVGSDDLFDTIDYAYHTSVQSSVMCAKLAHGFLAPGGLLAMLGSKAALSPQPAMLSFSMGKAAVHQMVRSLALAVGGELPAGATVLALVPEVLDTPLHREMNGGRAASTWTPCDAVASKLLQWATRPETRPPNASFVSVSTSADEAAASKHQFRLIDVPATFVHMTPL